MPRRARFSSLAEEGTPKVHRKAELTDYVYFDAIFKSTPHIFFLGIFCRLSEETS